MTDKFCGLRCKYGVKGSGPCQFTGKNDAKYIGIVKFLGCRAKNTNIKKNLSKTKEKYALNNPDYRGNDNEL